MGPVGKGEIGLSEFKGVGLLDQICDALTASIVNGELKGGHQLKEIELQKHFQVSRSPLREAFRELEKRGLLEIKPRRGTFVKKLTLKNIEQSFNVRAVLEGLAAREAHSQMSADDLEMLASYVKEMRQAADLRDSVSVLEFVRLFHSTFISCSENSALITCLSSLPVHFMWKRFVWAYSSKEMENAVKRHEKLLGYFLDRDCAPETVERAVREHLETSITRLGSYLAKGNMLD